MGNGMIMGDYCSHSIYCATHNNYKFPLPFFCQSSYYKRTRIKEAPWLQKTDEKGLSFEREVFFYCRAY